MMRHQTTFFFTLFLSIAYWSTCCHSFHQTFIWKSSLFGSLLPTNEACSRQSKNSARRSSRVGQQQQQQQEQSPYYTVTVSYQGESCEIQVAQGESILSAMEKSWNTRHELPLPGAQLPFDCRRGNCLTCAAKCVPIDDDNRQDRILVRSDDGLSPAISKAVADLGYILTCSSYVQADGLHLELGENHRLWDLIYRKRLEHEDAQLAARKAMARVIRKRAERNVAEWKEETEQVLKSSGGGGGDHVL